MVLKSLPCGCAMVQFYNLFSQYFCRRKTMIRWVLFCIFFFVLNMAGMTIVLVIISALSAMIGFVTAWLVEATSVIMKTSRRGGEEHRQQVLSLALKTLAFFSMTGVLFLGVLAGFLMDGNVWGNLPKCVGLCLLSTVIGFFLPPISFEK